MCIVFNFVLSAAWITLSLTSQRSLDYCVDNTLSSHLSGLVDCKFRPFHEISYNLRFIVLIIVAYFMC